MLIVYNGAVIQLIFDLLTAAFFVKLFLKAVPMYTKKQDKMFETASDYQIRRYTAVGLMIFYVLAAYVSIFVFRFKMFGD